MTLTFDNVPRAAVDQVLAQVKAHGVEFFFSATHKGDLTGTFSSEAGTGTFVHDGESNCLSVTILGNKGHFPPLMLKGGLKQLVSEAVEALNA